MPYESKKSTDEWFPVILLDDTDGKTPETGVAFGDLTVKYALMDGTDTWNTYTVATGDWHEKGEGVYSLRIGATEFTAEDKYEVAVAAAVARTHRFAVEVTDKTKAEMIDDIDTLLSRVTAAVATATALSTHDGKLDTVDANVDLVLADTAEIGTAGAGLTDLGGMSTAMKAEVEVEVDDAITAAEPIDANMTQIGGLSVAGNVATLTLKQLDVQNSTGSAIISKSTGDNGHGIEAEGNGVGNGINGKSGASGGAGIRGLGQSTADGIRGDGGANAGSGIRGKANAKSGGDTDGNGIIGEGYSGAGVGGRGIIGIGGTGTTDSPGIEGIGLVNGDGIRGTGAGTGKDISASEIDAILADTADMQPKLGTVVDLGDGTTLADNMTSLAGKTASAARYDRTTDSQEAIVDAGGAADWTSGEKEQIRDSLGVDGTKTTAAGGQLQTIDSNVDLVLADTADIQPKMGVFVDLGDGATVAENMTALAGKTTDAASYDRTTDSQEAIIDAGGAADWSSTEKENIRNALGVDGTKTAPTGGYGRVGDPAGASLAVDIAAVKVDTAEIGTAGVGLTDLGGMSTAMKAEVEVEVGDAIAAAEPIDANLTQIGGVAQSATDLKDFADVCYDPSSHLAHTDVVNLNGAAQSLIDLQDFADSGYDPVTNKVEGVKTVDTLTGHTPQTGDSYAEIGTAGAGLTDLGGMSTGMKGEVQAEVDDALNAYDEAAGVASAAALDTVSGVVDAILVDTNEMQGKLPTNNIMGSSVKTDKDDEIDAILVDTAEIGVAGIGLTNLGGMSSAMKAEVNTEVDTALDELIPEPVVGAPSVTCSIRTGMARVYGIARNKGELNGTAGEKTYFNSSGVAISKKAVSDDGTTYEESAMTGV